MYSSTLISAEVLASHLNDPNWIVFDCRHDLRDLEYGEKAYLKGHIPGARFLHLDRDLSGPTTGRNGRHPLPDSASFAARMRELGVGQQSQVVAYDNEGNAFSARLWWLLRWLGHERVAVLDGGLPAWKRAKLPLDEAVPQPVPGDFAPRPGENLVDADWLLAHRGEALLIDARSPERYAGENETLDPVGGHVPGAINRFYYDNLDDPGIYFRDADELRAEFLALLAGRPPESVIQMCGSGVTACHNILAMEVAGLGGSKLYPGSWSEWCSDPARPRATGYYAPG